MRKDNEVGSDARGGGDRGPDGGAGAGRDARLPRVLEQMWGIGEKPRKGPKPSLTLDAIVSAAIGIADDQGLASLSMSRVAKRLDVTAMALYRHVDGKDDLLVLMADAIAGAPPVAPRLDPGDTPDGWRLAIAHWSRAYLALLQRHPWILQVGMSTPPMAPHSLDWTDAGLQALADTALTESDKLGVVLMLHNYIRGSAELANDLFPAEGVDRSGARGGGPEGNGGGGDADNGAAPDRPGGHDTPSYAAKLTRLVTAERYPALARALKSGAFVGAGESEGESEGSTDDTAVDFEFGLQVLLDGVARLMAAKSPDRVGTPD